MKRMLALIVGLFLPSCTAPDAEWVEGGLYVTANDDASYSVLKILKVDEGGVHVRLYSNRYPVKPEQIDESELYLAGRDRDPQEELGMGHAPISRKSFHGWGAELVQVATVKPEELDGYEIWQESKGGYF